MQLYSSPPRDNVVATLQPPANDTSNDILYVWLVSGAEHAGAAIGAKATPCTHQRRTPIQRWLPAQQVKAVAVFGWVTAHEADTVLKLHQLLN